MTDAANSEGSGSGGSHSAAAELMRHCSGFRKARAWVAAWQIINTLGPYLLLCTAMLVAARYQFYALTLMLGIPAGGLLVRLFIIQHDCGHGSFLSSRRLNEWLGRVLSLLTVTPFDSWKRAHALHHASNGDLSRRGTGDITTLTTEEYAALSRFGRLRYRLYRNPIVLIVIGSPLNFLILQRLPFAVGLPWRVAFRDVMILNLCISAVVGLVAVLAGGILPALLVILPPIVVASWAGGWLFFVQHQYEGVRWQAGDAWDPHVAALEGSSHYVLPPLLRWLSGNVGLHHVHHLNSRIPNYRLKECMDAHSDLSRVGRLTVRDSLKSIRLALWDEERKAMIGFRDLRNRSA